jgi:hypothetical protein
LEVKLFRNDRFHIPPREDRSTSLWRWGKVTIQSSDENAV